LNKSAVLIFVLVTGKLFAQPGGLKAFRFLDIPATARAAALGGNSMSIWGDDINLMHSNPALLNPTMNKQAALNHANYVGDIKTYYLAYGHQMRNHGTLGLGLQAFDYGKFKGYDEFGGETGTFRSSDYSINLSYAKPLSDSSFNVGISLKTLISQYETYNAFGNAIDLGVTWHNKKELVISLLAKNIGVVWKGFNPGGQEEELPNTVQLGLSQKVAKAPFRIFFVYDQLLKWNLRYVSPIDTLNTSNAFGETAAIDSTGWQRFSKRFGTQADNFMRHITLGTEILLTKNFNIRVAYNYRRQREMILPEARGVNGLSFGLGFRVKRFGFAYSFSKLAAAGNSSMFSITFGW
jgi:hypothetical protein